MQHAYAYARRARARSADAGVPQLLLNLAAAEESDAQRMRHARIAPAIYGGLQISFRRETELSRELDATTSSGQEPGARYV